MKDRGDPRNYVDNNNHLNCPLECGDHRLLSFVYSSEFESIYFFIYKLNLVSNFTLHSTIHINYVVLMYSTNVSLNCDVLL